MVSERLDVPFAALPEVTFDRSFARDLPGLAEPWQPAPVTAPELLVTNDELAARLGIDPASLRTPAGVAVLVGNAVPEHSGPVAQAYAGHQFGGYSPRLGDGRALLLGEVIAPDGARLDLQLKGSGRTPFARGGDGRAAVGPMLREYVIGEALHALGIPTTRALAVVATGESVMREQALPGAVLARVATSHLRVGTFQYAAATRDRDLLVRLTDYAIDRHHPDAGRADNRALALLRCVIEAQAALVARWMEVGFIHGVMNTDNMTISGESIDFGPCAFLDGFDPGTVFSSIDHGGRYAYGNQPAVAQWNLARLAEALLPLIDPEPDRAVELATEALHGFVDSYETHWYGGMLAKLGIADGNHRTEADRALVDDYCARLGEQRVDFSGSFRALADWLRGDERPVDRLFTDRPAFAAWSDRWQARLGRGARAADPIATAAAMDERNPRYIARNHLVEEALAAATAGDLDPLQRLVARLRDPFTVQSGSERYAEPADTAFTASYRTFCGT
ncbi:MAG: protein adenylyltransferase SelO [Actinomycetota bacterium]